MQNKKRKKPVTKSHSRKQHRQVRFEDLLEDDRFDDEDYDSVTEDTLEFLSLDDDMIEAYQKEQASKSKTRVPASKSHSARYVEEDDGDDEDEIVYVEEVYEDEDDEDEIVYEDEDDEDEIAYEDEDDEDEIVYEDEDDEDEAVYEDDEDDEDYDDEDEDDDYEYYEDDEDDDGFAARLMHFIGEMNGLDIAVAVLGILVLVGAVVTGGIYVHARSTAKQVASFVSVGEEIEGVSVIGESGLLAVSESARLGNMIDVIEEDQQEQETEEDENGEISVELHLTSILSDLKIKFVNKKSGKLIGGVPFEVEISGPKNYTLKDDDKDGVIYQTDVAAGSYDVKILPLSGENAGKYKLPSGSSSVKVTDKIAYEKVDVADEVKSESEINVAQEEATVQNTVVESTLKDTVEWVESTKTPIEGEGGKAEYEQVPLENIVDPWKTTSAFRKMVEGDENNTGGTTGGNNAGDNNPGGGTTGGDNTGGTTGGDNTGGTTGGDNTGGTTGGDNTGGTTGGDNTGGTTGGDNTGGTTGGDNTGGTTGGDNTGGTTGGDNPSSGGTTSTGSTSSGGTTSTGSTSSGGTTSTGSTSSSGTTSSGAITSTPAPSVSINKGNITLEVGKTDSLTVSAENGVLESVKWSSDNEKVARVDNGKVTAIGTGSATITAQATVSGQSMNPCKCTVTVQNVSVTYKKLTIHGPTKVSAGKTVTLTVETDPKDGNAVWSSENEKIAKVDASGVVTGIAEGKVKIWAVCKGANEIKEFYEIEVLKGVDGEAKLKDKDGNQLYYKDGDEYKEATFKDFTEHKHFYKRKAGAYKYTGWQTIEGYLYYFDKNGNYVTGDQVIQGAKYTFGSDGRMAKSSGTMGIDVSKHNGNIDWNAVKNSGVSYVIIRCGYRGYSTGVLVEDPKFRSNIQGAKAAGLKVGAYFFSQAVNEVEAVEEASMAIDLVKGYGLNYPLFLDVEGSGGRADGISRDTRTAVCRTFCQTVQNSGIQAGIYANKTWFTEKISTASLTSYKLWLAQYASAPTYTATRYDLWQYSSKGKVSGISGNVDMNISYVNY